MNEPETGKWYVIADKEIRWGSFWPEKLGHLDCEIKPGAVICFWLKVRSDNGEESWEVTVKGCGTCFIRDIPLEVLAEFQYPELTPGKLYRFENPDNHAYLVSGDDNESTTFNMNDSSFFVRKVEGSNGEQWEVIYHGELFVLCLNGEIPVEVKDDADF